MVFKPQTFHEMPPQTEVDDPTEADLEARVAEALARAGTADASQVDVTVTGRTVLLIGTVGMPREAGILADVAAAVPGVESVENRIEALGPDIVSPT